MFVQGKYVFKEVDPSTTYVSFLMFQKGIRYYYAIQEYDNFDDAEDFFLANSEDEIEGSQRHAEIIKVR